MSIDTSNSFNSNGLISTLRRSLTKRFSQNRFSLNPEGHVTQKTEFIFNTGTLRTSNTKESSQSNWTQTLGRSRKFGKSLSESPFKSALAQAIEKFSDDGIRNELTNVPEKFHIQKDTSFAKTIRRRLNINLEKPEEIKKCLEKAKKSFQSSEYKEAKKLFKLLGKIPESSLYLAAIYLLEGNGTKAKEYLIRIPNPYLKVVMDKHAEHILDVKKRELPFPDASFYLGIGSEDEKIVEEKLRKT